MKYPSVAEVVAADREQIAFWWCFLPEPHAPEEGRALDLIFIKHYAMGALFITEPRRTASRPEQQVIQILASKGAD